MKKIEELNLGFSDAENYKRRENKMMFDSFFVKSEELDQLLNSSKYFLIGEKGTGKTAYAVYLSNNYYKDTKAAINFIRETDYQKFITLKKQKHLELSDYTSIWKVILLLLISQQVSENEPHDFIENVFNQRFKALNRAIQEYYLHAFSPEILTALNLVEQSKDAAEVFSEYMKFGGEQSKQLSFSESRFQMNLYYLQRKFEEAISSSKFKNHHILFIDGIDIRPSNIDYDDYLACVKGLANATWSLNTDFFADIKDSKGRLKVVLLIRPDIFANLGLQNLNNKIRDNSVFLDLRTAYPTYRNSLIFRIVDNLLNAQQQVRLQHGLTWDAYFPYKVHVAGKNEESFIPFLRYSMSRPRDIITAISILKENYSNKNQVKLNQFTQSDFDNSDFRNKWSIYLLGEIKDFMIFYYTEHDYEIFLKFFEYLDGKFQFDYAEYSEMYGHIQNYLFSNNISKPQFLESKDSFLQFLYELNVICYIEQTSDESFFKWCYKERSYANLYPKIKTGAKYQIHYGLSKALGVGKKITNIKR